MAQFYSDMTRWTRDSLSAQHFTELAEFYKNQLPVRQNLPPVDGTPPSYTDTRLRNGIEKVIERSSVL